MTGIGKYQLPYLRILLSGAIAPVMPWVATITLIIAALGSVVFLAIRKDKVKPSFTNKFIQSIALLDNRPNYRGYFSYTYLASSGSGSYLE